MSILEKATLEMIKNILEGVTVPKKAKIAEIAKLLGEDTVGGTSQPIYLKDGVPTACSDTVGGTSQPIYLKDGVPTACSDTVGGTAQPVYIKDGVPTACSDTVGGTAQPVYIKDGVPTACSDTVGSSTKPVYMKDGKIAEGSPDDMTVGKAKLLNPVASANVTKVAVATLTHNSSKTISFIYVSQPNTNNNGCDVLVGGGGSTVIGSGESAGSCFAEIISAGTEYMYITSDQTIIFYTNANTYANKKTFSMNNDGTMTLGASPSTSDDSLKAATTAWVRDTEPYVGDYHSTERYVWATKGSPTPQWLSYSSLLGTTYTCMLDDWSSVYPGGNNDSHGTKHGMVRFLVGLNIYLQICYGVFNSAGTISFSKSFAKPPFVMTSPWSGSDMNIARVSVKSVTTTGFTTFSSGSSYHGIYIAIGYTTA